MKKPCCGLSKSNCCFSQQKPVLLFNKYIPVKKWKIRLTLFVLLPAILLGSTGMSLHSIYCLCKGERFVSLISTPQACANEHADAGHLSVAKKACCRVGAGFTPDKPRKADGFHKECCTQQQHVFLKIPTQSFTESVTFGSLSPTFIVLPLWAFTQLQRPAREAFRAAIFYPPPPTLPGGSAWLPFAQSFLC